MRKLLFLFFLISGFVALIQSCRSTSLAISKTYIEKQYTNHESKFVKLSNSRIHYKEKGSGETIVLVHGLLASTHIWDRIADSLAQHYRVIRLDLPGHGLSDITRLGIGVNIPYYTETLYEFMTKVGIEKCHLAGCSMGGWVSWEFTTQHPEMVNKLLLIDAAGLMEEKEKPLIATLLNSSTVQKILPSGLPQFAVKRIMKKAVHNSDYLTDEMVQRRYDLVNREGNFQTLRSLVSQSDFRSHNITCLEEIKQPTLILWGAKDKVVKVSHAYEFARAIPNNQLIIYENTGHIPHLEKPQRVLKDMLVFLQ